MPTVRDDALVLKIVESGEADLIVHLLAGTRGRRTAFASGARKSRRRFVGALQPFSNIRAIFTVRRTRSLDRLESADLIDSYRAIHENLARIYMASYYCELMDAMLVEGETYPEVYALALFFLERLSKSEPSLKHRIFFELRLLDLLGYRPELKVCGEDGVALKGKAWFDPARQAFLCRESAALGETVPVSERARRAMIQVLDTPLDLLGDIRMDRETARETAAVTRALVLANADRRLKSLDMLEDEL